MTYLSTLQLVQKAYQNRMVIPGFNVPYLPMIEPVVQALVDTDCFGLVMVARLEWEKFGAKSPQAIAAEYQKHKQDKHTRLHLDHIPVIDEDFLSVNYLEIIQGAMDVGFESVMVDGSRLPLLDNIACTRTVVEAAHAVGIPVEGELGAVLGHESGPMPSYDELFSTGKGFTHPMEAHQFAKDAGVDWLSVAIGNIHGAISQSAKNQPKLVARLNISHLEAINQSTNLPLVLHGGSGIQKDNILAAIKHGIAKINIGTAIRQPYERAINQGVPAAQTAVYKAMLEVIQSELEISGSSTVLFGDH